MDWIVVVDDDITNLKMAGMILSRHNMRVTALRSGASLLSYIQGNRPDLILLDIKMPEMDCFETMEKLRALMPGDPVPVIFLTADDISEGHVRMLRCYAETVQAIRETFRNEEENSPDGENEDEILEFLPDGD